MKKKILLMLITCIFVSIVNCMVVSAQGVDHFDTWVNYNSWVDYRYYYSNIVPKSSSSLYADVCFTVRSPGSTDIEVYLIDATTKSRVTTTVSVPHTYRGGNNGTTTVHPKYTAANSSLNRDLQLVVKTNSSTVTSIEGSWSPISNYSPNYK